MTTSNLILEIVQLFKQIDKKASQKELIEILKKYKRENNGKTRIRIYLWILQSII